MGDIEDLQALMRRSAPAQRSEAVARLLSLQGTILDGDVARAALRAAGAGYPWVPGVPDDTSELFVQLLWSDPTVVDVTDLERTYMLCAERGRRAVLHAMALRADRVGLEAVEYILDTEGARESLPGATGGLLSPLLVVEGVHRLAPRLITLALQRGWCDHTAEMVMSMCERGLLDPADIEHAAALLVPIVCELTDACDHLATPRTMGIPRRGDPMTADMVRVDRRRLMTLVELLANLRGAAASAGLRRALSCADPRVSAAAAVGLMGRGEVVGEDRLALLCRSPLARAVLVDGLTPLRREFQLPPSALTPVAVAEAHLVCWLASATQLRCGPDEVAYRGVVPADPQWGRGLLYVFAFRVNEPHWVARRDWVVAAVGPFDPSAELNAVPGEGFAVHSLYEPETSMSHGEHVLEITRSLCAIRDEPTL